MTPDTAENSRLAFALCLTFILMVPLAIAGLALINTGLGRSRSAAHAMTSSLCVISVAVLVYFAWGFAIQGYPDLTFFGGAGHGTDGMRSTFAPAGIAAISIPGRQARVGPLLHRCRRFRSNSGYRWIDGPVFGLAAWPAPRKVFIEWHARRDSSAQRRLCRVRLHAGVDRLDGAEFCKRDPVCLAAH